MRGRARCRQAGPPRPARYVVTTAARRRARPRLRVRHGEGDVVVRRRQLGPVHPQPARQLPRRYLALGRQTRQQRSCRRAAQLGARQREAHGRGERVEGGRQAGPGRAQAQVKAVRLGGQVGEGRPHGRLVALGQARQQRALLGAAVAVHHKRLAAAHRGRHLDGQRRSRGREGRSREGRSAPPRRQARTRCCWLCLAWRPACAPAPRPLPSLALSIRPSSLSSPNRRPPLPNCALTRLAPSRPGSSSSGGREARPMSARPSRQPGGVTASCSGGTRPIICGRHTRVVWGGPSRKRDRGRWAGHCAAGQQQWAAPRRQGKTAVPRPRLPGPPHRPTGCRRSPRKVARSQGAGLTGTPRAASTSRHSASTAARSPESSGPRYTAAAAASRESPWARVRGAARQRGGRSSAGQPNTRLSGARGGGGL